MERRKRMRGEGAWMAVRSRGWSCGGRRAPAVDACPRLCALGLVCRASLIGSVRPAYVGQMVPYCMRP